MKLLIVLRIQCGPAFGETNHMTATQREAHPGRETFYCEACSSCPLGTVVPGDREGPSLHTHTELGAYGDLALRAGDSTPLTGTTTDPF